MGGGTHSPSRLGHPPKGHAVFTKGARNGGAGGGVEQRAGHAAYPSICRLAVTVDAQTERNKMATMALS
jgi:hypothetical protein